MADKKVNPRRDEYWGLRAWQRILGVFYHYATNSKRTTGTV